MKTRKLTYFDLFTLNMVIKGAWIYRELPETSALQASLNKCLKPYPWLLGHYEEKQKSVVWSGNETSIRLTEIDGSGHSVAEDMYTLVPEFSTKDFKSGKARALEAYRIRLDDGQAIVLQGAHALMDGSTFYRLVSDWGKITAGQPTGIMTSGQDLIPDADALDKAQTLASVQELGWHRIEFKSLFGMMVNLVAMNLIKKTYTIELTQDELARMRNESGAGTNAVLCRYAVSRLLEKFPSKDSFTLLQVADLRGRACSVPDDFFGNFSQPVVLGNFSRDASANSIQEALSAAISNSQALSENVQLTISASEHSLPYFFFDATNMNSRDPKLFYINNQLKFKACRIDFGTGLPLRAQQAMLPDMIKFWQPKADGPVQIIYGGWASKIMRRK